jgi:hypothetical protein
LSDARANRWPAPTLNRLARADPATSKGKQEGVNPDAIDPGQAERLWTVSAQLTGIDAFAAG